MHGYWRFLKYISNFWKAILKKNLKLKYIFTNIPCCRVSPVASIPTMRTANNTRTATSIDRNCNENSNVVFVFTTTLTEFSQTHTTLAEKELKNLKNIFLSWISYYFHTWNQHGMVTGWNFCFGFCSLMCLFPSNLKPMSSVLYALRLWVYPILPHSNRKLLFHHSTNRVVFILDPRYCNRRWASFLFFFF